VCGQVQESRGPLPVFLRLAVELEPGAPAPAASAYRTSGRRAPRIGSGAGAVMREPPSPVAHPPRLGRNRPPGTGPAGPAVRWGMREELDHEEARGVGAGADRGGRGPSADRCAGARRLRGAGARDLAGLRVGEHAVDRLAQVELVEGRIEELPLEDAIADSVISTGVINLSPNKGRVVREAARLLRPSGRSRPAARTRSRASPSSPRRRPAPAEAAGAPQRRAHGGRGSGRVPARRAARRASGWQRSEGRHRPRSEGPGRRGAGAAGNPRAPSACGPDALGAGSGHGGRGMQRSRW